MKSFILIFLIILIKPQNNYEDLINEKVSEEFCNQVITNLTTVLNETYVYLDFIKAPKQPQGYDNYIPKVDLINELNNINKKERTFLDFYRDIINILDKTRDGGHLYFGAMVTPNGNDIANFYYCIPFNYFIKEIFDDNGKVNDTYLSIQPSYECEEGYSDEILLKIEELENIKIISINNLTPFDYFEKMSLKFRPLHSPQARFIDMFMSINYLFMDFYPFKKEELNISIVFEGNEKLELEYQASYYETEDEEYKQFFKSEKQKMYKNKIPIEEIELKYKVKKGLIFKNPLREVTWGLSSKNDNLKCAVDQINKYNVIYQNSFSPEDISDYQQKMYQCFSVFYSNDYKIIVIEDRNGGGVVKLCTPFTNYLHPKIEKRRYSAMKISNANNEYYFKNNYMLNPFTCKPFTDEDKFSEGEEDIYSEKVIHKRTKFYDDLDIYTMLDMERKKKIFTSVGIIKKPTEIIIFTDGYSLSCTSSLITELQTYGSAIIVGYNPRPDLSKKYFDASQSNSGVNTYKEFKYVQNLNNLGFSISITNSEQFSPNDKNTPRTPFEFLVNPVDEIVKIYSPYSDEIYDRFIKEADSIFEKYNDLENGECNPDNNYLYYETSDCDSILNIDKAHGGYICGSDKKWNKSNCIAAYCDEGYILNDERTKCEKSMCDLINYEEIEIDNNLETPKEYNFAPMIHYIVYIEEENISYYFLSNKEYLMYY